MDNPDPAIFGIIALVAILIFAAVVSMAGKAFSSLNEGILKELETKGNKRVVRLRRMVDSNKDYDMLVKIATTLFTVLFGAISVREFYPILKGWMLTICNIKPDFVWFAEFISMLVIVVVASYIFMLVAVTVPKRIAAQKAGVIAASTVGILVFLKGFLTPLCAAINGPARVFVKLTGYDPEKREDDLSEEGILQILDDGEEQGVIEESQKEMIENIFEFDDTVASDVMTHRTDIVAVEISDSIENTVRLAIEEGYSRIPVFEDYLDNIKGILYVKDLLRFIGNSIPDKVKISDIMREAIFVPESKKCRELFSEMTEKRVQLVVVSDEYGGVAGIVSIEDLIEEIVGNIQDEFDDESEEFTQIEEGIFNVEGTSEIEEVEELLGIEFPDGDYETVAGFIMSVIGRIPEKGEHPVIEYGGYTFTVTEMDERRIVSMVIERHTEEQSNEE